MKVSSKFGQCGRASLDKKGRKVVKEVAEIYSPCAALMWCEEHEDEVMAGAEVDLTDDDSDETDDDENDKGPVTFVSEASMTTATQKLVEKLRNKERQVFRPSAAVSRDGRVKSCTY